MAVLCKLTFKLTFSANLQTMFMFCNNQTKMKAYTNWYIFKTKTHILFMRFFSTSPFLVSHFMVPIAGLRAGTAFSSSFPGQTLTCISLCAASYIWWHHGTAFACRMSMLQLSINISQPTGPQQQTHCTLLHEWYRQMDGQTNRRRDTIPFRRSCSAYYVGSANNTCDSENRQVAVTLSSDWGKLLVLKQSDTTKLLQNCNQHSGQPNLLLLLRRQWQDTKWTTQ